MKKRNSRFLIIIFLFSFSSVTYSMESFPNVNNIKMTEIGLVSYGDTAKIFARDIAIINGDHNEYVKFCNECVRKVVNDTLPREIQQIWLLYAAIMAEQFHDTLAAFDFARIIESSNVEIDSSLSTRVIKYYEMASKMRPDAVPFIAAHRLFIIFMNGLYGIPQDKKKAFFYDKLSESIAKAING